MTMKSKRRGQTWQNADWRRFITLTGDLGERARTAFAKMRQQRAAPPTDEHSFARTPAPYTGDAVAAGGEFVVKPEYRSFA